MAESTRRRVVVLCIGGFLLALGLLTACELPEPTCTATWVGPGTGAFGDGANWSTGTVPGASDRACASADIAISVTGDRQLASAELPGEVTVPSGATLTIGGTLDPSRIGQLTVRGTFAANSRTDVGVLDAFGAQLVGSGLLLVDGPWATIGAGRIGGSQLVVLEAPTALYGDVRLCDRGGLHVAGPVRTEIGYHVRLDTRFCAPGAAPTFSVGDTGELTVLQGLTVDGPTMTNAGRVVVQGELHATYRQTAGSTTLGGSGLDGSLQLDGGRLDGSGPITGTLSGAGAVAPGSATDPTRVGTVTVARWSPAPGATVALDVAGPTTADAVVVTGEHADLEPVAVTHAFVGGYSPAAGDRWTSFAGVTGAPASVVAPDVAGRRVAQVAVGSTSVLTVDDCVAPTYSPGASLAGASLDGLHLFACGLAGADLSAASAVATDLARADLAGVHGRGAVLRDADLTGADLSGADLADAVVDGATLTSVVWDDTTCPDGSNSDGNGGTCEGHLLARVTFTVTTTTDADDVAPGDGVCATSAGACSLRAAVREVSALDLVRPPTVVLGPGLTYPLTVTGGDTDAAGDLDVRRPVKVVGNGSTVDASGAGDRALEVHAGPVELRDLVLTGGSAGDGGGLRIGAGVATELRGVTVAGNDASGRGGGIDVADSTPGASARLSLAGSTIEGNVAGGDGGGIHIGYHGVLDVTGSSVTGNRSGGWGGGLFAEHDVTVAASTIAGNSTPNGDGGGLYVASGPLAMSATTVSGNEALVGGGVRMFFGTGLSLAHVTITANRGVGAGIVVEDGSPVAITSSIVADQAAGDDCRPGFALTDGGQNVESGSSCGFTAPSDRQHADPGLAPLASAGGPTQVHVPAADSSAVDLVPVGTAACGEDGGQDQRGVARPQGAGCDSGAVEWVAGESPAADCSPVLTAGAQRQYCDLSGHEYRNVDLHGMDLTGANLTGTTFTGVDLDDVRFAGATLTDASLFGGSAARIDLAGAKVTGASFALTAGFDSATGLRSTLTNGWRGLRINSQPVLIDLTGMDLQGRDVEFASFAGADLSGAHLAAAAASNATFGKARGADLSGIVARGSSFFGDLTGADLTGATLDSAFFYNMTLSGTDLTGADVSSATFRSTPTLSDAVGFESTAASGWDGLVIADASVDLSGFDLRGADLHGAKIGSIADNRPVVDLSGADLTGADVTAAQFLGVDFRDAVGLNAAIGLRRPHPDWRRNSFAGTGLDLAGLDLSGGNFEEADLSGVDFTGSNLANARWFDATVAGATFRGTQVGCCGSFATTAANGWQGTDFGGGALWLTDSVRGADLEGADLSGAGIHGDLVDVNLRGADLTGADLATSNLDGADLTGATVTGASFSRVLGLEHTTGFASTAVHGWAGLRVDGTRLNLQGADLRNVDLRGAVLGNESFVVPVVLAGADLTGADLAGATIANVDLSNARGLTRAQLESLAHDWRKASLVGTGVDLGGAALRGRLLSLADVRGIRFAGADLTGANLSGARLAGADLTGATVAGAWLAGADLTSVVGLRSTNVNGWDDLVLDATGLDLSGLDLGGVIFFPDRLVGTNLTNADLGGNPYLDRATFVGVTFANTTCPDLVNSDAAGGTCVGHLVP